MRKLLTLIAISGLVYLLSGEVGDLSLSLDQPSAQLQQNSGAVILLAEKMDWTDGDTFNYDDGAQTTTFRLQGINAPEIGKDHPPCQGEAALEMVRQAAAEAIYVGGVKSEQDQYGRTLFSTSTYTSDLEAELVGAGLALVYNGSNQDTNRIEQLASLEAEAYSSGLGLWSPTACADLGSKPVDVTTTAIGQIQAVGSEQIEIVTVVKVDISGWWLADNSSKNRFRFPASTRLGAGQSVTVGCRSSDFTPEWCPDSVWNNGGDSVTLYHSDGWVVDHRRY